MIYLFQKMVNSIPEHIKEIDILLVTPGGSAQQVAKFVDKLRPRFEKVSFIIPNVAMSAGTIFVMSGNEIIMDPQSYIGPIDPQIPNRDGAYIPAQAILTLVEDIQQRGQTQIDQGKSPQWTDLQLLRQTDARDIGNAINASKYSIDLVTEYLYLYKFADWNVHASTGNPVTPEEKKARSKEIAELLCAHSLWKSHGRGINRHDVKNTCRIEITHTETIQGLERATRRFWAFLYWAFGATNIYKMFISENYCIIRSQMKPINDIKN